VVGVASIAEIHLIRRVIALKKEHLLVIIAVVRDTSVENAPELQKKRLATVVASLATSLAIALSLARQLTPPAAVQTTPAEVEVAKSATNVAKLVTSLVIARRVEATAVDNKVAVDMVAVDIVAVAMADASRLVTLAEGMATWRATALKVKSATTAAKLVTSHAIAPLKVMGNESATSANSPVTSRQLALISLSLQWIMIGLYCFQSRQKHNKKT